MSIVWYVYTGEVGVNEFTMCHIVGAVWYRLYNIRHVNYIWHYSLHSVWSIECTRCDMYSACSVACIAKYESRMRVESSLQQHMYCRISNVIYSMSRFVCIIFSSVSSVLWIACSWWLLAWKEQLVQCSMHSAYGAVLITTRVLCNTNSVT